MFVCVSVLCVQGYREKAAFIATQGPLPDTIEDFWRMVWEKNTASVVMLTQLVENGIVSGTHTHARARTHTRTHAHNWSVFMCQHDLFV